MNIQLIERYLMAVGSHLPKKGRQDVQAEIRTLVEDMLEDRYPGSAPDEGQVSAVLNELGDPQKMAAKFQPEKYLIGPKTYPFFIKVLQIVLAAVSGALLLSLIISNSFFTTGGFTQMDWGTIFLNFLQSVYTGLLSAFATLVIIFHIIERTTSSDKFEEDQDWNPADLPQLEGPEPFHPVKLAWEISFSLLIGIVLNFFPQWVGIFSQVNGEWSFMPMLSPAFFDLLPFINLGIFLAIALNLYVLRKGGWAPISEVLKFAADIYQLGILVLIVSTPVLGLNPESIAYHNISPANVRLYEDLFSTINFSVNMGLSVAIVVLGVLKFIDLIKRLSTYQAVANRS